MQILIISLILCIFTQNNTALGFLKFSVFLTFNDGILFIVLTLTAVFFCQKFFNFNNCHHPQKKGRTERKKGQKNLMTSKQQAFTLALIYFFLIFNLLLSLFVFSPHSADRVQRCPLTSGKGAGVEAWLN